MRRVECGRCCVVRWPTALSGERVQLFRQVTALCIFRGIFHIYLFRAVCQDESGAAARAALHRPVATWAQRLASGRGPDFAPLHSPLSAREVAPTLGLLRPLFASKAPWYRKTVRMNRGCAAAKVPATAESTISATA